MNLQSIARGTVFALRALLTINTLSLPVRAQGPLPPAPISPPLPDTIIRIQGLVNGMVAIKNTGKRAITAAVFQITIPGSQNYTDLNSST